MSDAPTQRLEPTPDAAQPGAPGPRRGRGPVIALIVVAALLAAAVVVALVLVLLPHGAPVAVSTTSATPTTSSAAPSPTASSPAPSPTATAKSGSGGSGGSRPSGGSFTSLQPTSPVMCSTGGPYTQPVRPDIQVSWSTAHAQSVWIVAGTSDAADSKYMKLPTTGSEKDFSEPIGYQCSQKSEVFTLTLVGDDGTHVSKQFTIENAGDTF